MKWCYIWDLLQNDWWRRRKWWKCRWSKFGHELIIIKSGEKVHRMIILWSVSLEVCFLLTYLIPLLWMNKGYMNKDFPGGPVVKDPLANVRDTGLIPGPGRFNMPRNNQACSPQLLSPCSRALKPQWLKPVCRRTSGPQQKQPPQCEAHILQIESTPCLPQLQKARTQHRRK